MDKMFATVTSVTNKTVGNIIHTHIEAGYILILLIEL